MVTDHKPLVKLFGNRALDQITNSRLFSLKQCTFPWRFSATYRPGKENTFSDATSRHPVHSDEVEGEEVSSSEILDGVIVAEPEEADNDHTLAALSNNDAKHVKAITWELVKQGHAITT